MANFIYLKRSWDQCNTVIQSTLSRSLPTAGDCDLSWLADHAIVQTAAYVTVVWVIDSGASCHLCTEFHTFNSIQKLLLPIGIEPGDKSKVTVSQHELVDISQQYVVNALYMPMFWLSLHSLNQLVMARYTSTIGCRKCSILSQSITMTVTWVNNLYIISPATAPTSTSVSTKSTSPWRNRINERASPKADTTISQRALSTEYHMPT